MTKLVGGKPCAWRDLNPPLPDSRDLCAEPPACDLYAQLRSCSRRVTAAHLDYVDADAVAEVNGNRCKGRQLE